MAPQKRIDHIWVTKYRGATTETEIEFDASKPFVLIFGENGTGKSTIVDAIDLVANGVSGSIEDISGATLSQHGPSIGCKPADVCVAVSIAGQKRTAKMKGNKVSVTPTQAETSVAILRRSKILSLVTAQPRERFEKLKRFIDVDAVQKSEEALSKAVNEAEAKLRETTDAIIRAEQALVQAHAQDHTDGEANLSPEEWAKQRSQIDTTEADKRHKLLKRVVDLEQEAVNALAEKNRCQEELDAKRSALADIEREVQTRQGLSAGNGVALVELLRKAHEYIATAGAVDACPVCKKSNDAPTLLSTIDGTLNEMTDLVDLAQRLADAKKDVGTTETSTERAYTKLVNSVTKLTTAIEELPPELLAGYSLGRDAFPNLYAWDGKLTPENIEEGARYLNDVSPLAKRIQSEIEIVARKLAQQSGVKRDYDALVEARAGSVALDKTKAVLEGMLETVRKTRIKFVQDILDAVADECDRLYQQIHDGELSGGVRFALDEEKRGSMNLLGSFEGHDGVPPQAYFSESHLDTLGFCFFLALTHHTTKGDAIVVLDDTFTSVDLNHIERILNVLMDEADRYHQIIMTTHQRRWLTFFETNRAPRDKVDLITLYPWSRNKGVNAGRISTFMEKLRDRLKPGILDRQGIGNAAGMLIETILEEVTKALGCRIVRNPTNRYTCSPLLDSIMKPAKTLKVVVISAAGTVEEELDDPPLENIVMRLKETLSDGRNLVGDHFNWDAADVTDAQVIEFGEKALALAERFVCNKCGAMATKKTDNGFTCSCGIRKVIK